MLDDENELRVEVECERVSAWYKREARDILALGCETIVACPELMPVATVCGSFQGTSKSTGQERLRFEANAAISELREFESELATRFAADATCAGVRFVRGRSIANKVYRDAVSAPHWLLSLDFEPSKEKQGWTIGDRRTSSLTLTKGSGGPAEIATTVCAIVLERGATLAN